MGFFWLLGTSQTIFQQGQHGNSIIIYNQQTRQTNRRLRQKLANRLFPAFQAFLAFYFVRFVKYLILFCFVLFSLFCSITPLAHQHTLLLIFWILCGTKRRQVTTCPQPYCSVIASSAQLISTKNWFKTFFQIK